MNIKFKEVEIGWFFFCKKEKYFKCRVNGALGCNAVVIRADNEGLNRAGDLMFFEDDTVVYYQITIS